MCAHGSPLWKKNSPANGTFPIACRLRIFARRGDKTSSSSRVEQCHPPDSLAESGVVSERGAWSKAMGRSSPRKAAASTSDARVADNTCTRAVGRPNIMAVANPPHRGRGFATRSARKDARPGLDRWRRLDRTPAACVPDSWRFRLENRLCLPALCEATRGGRGVGGPDRPLSPLQATLGCA